MNLKKALAVAVLALAAPLPACGTAQHPASKLHPVHTAPAAVATPAASPTAGPFATWSPVCQPFAAGMVAVGFTYTGNDGWATNGITTYGQLEHLASKFAHLSYVEMHSSIGNDDAQTANGLADAGTGFFQFLPAAAYKNSKYHQVMGDVASNRALNGWYGQYLVPITSDCTSGGG
jgi:hypothetical protein